MIAAVLLSTGCGLTKSVKTSGSPEAPWNKDPKKNFEVELGNGWREFGHEHYYKYNSGLTQPASVLARTSTGASGQPVSVFRRTKKKYANDWTFIVYDSSDLPLRTGWVSYWDIFRPEGTRRRLLDHPEPIKDGDLRLFITLPGYQVKLHLPRDAIAEDELGIAWDGKPEKQRFWVEFSSAEGDALPAIFDTARLLAKGSDKPAGTPNTELEPNRLKLESYDVENNPHKEVVNTLIDLVSRSDVVVKVYNTRSDKRDEDDRIIFGEHYQLVYTGRLPKAPQPLLVASRAHFAD
ncbi:MAG: hypothetical protein AAF648_04185 [Pseudomonadota bacterium]